MKSLLALLLLVLRVNGYLYGFDMVQVGTTSQFQCLKNLGYSKAIFRAYNPDGQGSFDQNAVTNIYNARSLLAIEVYLAPQPFSSKQGWQQFDEMYNGLKAAGISVSTVWIQVTVPSRWSPNYQQNIDFINMILIRMKAYGVNAGIFTSATGWRAITGDWKNAGNDVKLWYWNTSGWGESNESSPNFNDFVPFGAWTAPVMKQYGQGEVVCGVVIDKDSFQNGAPLLFAVGNGTVTEEKEGEEKTISDVE